VSSEVSQAGGSLEPEPEDELLRGNSFGSTISEPSSLASFAPDDADEPDFGI
jgi:hypothetical protein